MPSPNETRTAAIWRIGPPFSWKSSEKGGGGVQHVALLVLDRAGAPDFFLFRRVSSEVAADLPCLPLGISVSVGAQFG
jgi:hypothetical protein